MVIRGQDRVTQLQLCLRTNFPCKKLEQGFNLAIFLVISAIAQAANFKNTSFSIKPKHY